MRETVRALLAGDGTLSAVLTGGVYGGTEINRQETPAAFDANGEILPCALVKIESEQPVGPFNTSSRQFIVVYFYQRNGRVTIDTALARVFVLLNRIKLTAGVWQVKHANDVTDVEDQALGCSMAFSRYEIIRKR